MAQKKNYKNYQKNDFSYTTVSNWLSHWHPGWYTGGVFVFAAAGPNFTVLPALGLAVLFFVVTQGWRVHKWRQKRLAELAEQDQPDPGLKKMYEDYKNEKELLSKTKRQFIVSCNTSRIQGDDGRKKAPPTLRNMRTDINNNVLAEVITAGGNGVTISDIVAHADAIAEVAGAPGGLDVKRHKGVGQATLTWYYTDPIDGILPLEKVPDSPEGTLAYGVRVDGTAAYINMHQSLLIGGMTRKGKSVTLRALLADAVKKKNYIDLRIADTKKVQFAEFKDDVNLGKYKGYIKVSRYETTESGVKTMFKEMVDEKNNRLDDMGEVLAEQHQPTKAEPLVVALMDESLDLNELLSKGSKGDIGNIAYTGAQADFVLWACAQLGDKNSLGDVRDLIPQAICYAVKTYQQTDAVLGTGASSLGAMCHQLGDTPGVGWSSSTDSAYCLKFRTANVTKKESINIAQTGLYPYAQPENDGKDGRQVAVYRLRSFPDAFGGRQRLYNGKAVDPAYRFNSHQENDKKPWAGKPNDPLNEVDWNDAYQNLVWYDTEEQALEAEKLSIKMEKPLYNYQHNLDNPGRIDGTRTEEPSYKTVSTPKAKKIKPVKLPKPAAEPTNKEIKKEETPKNEWPVLKIPHRKPRPPKAPKSPAANGAKRPTVWGLD